MRIVDTQMALKNMSGTKTAQNWGKYIGEKPERLGLVATMYPENTLMNLVDSLRNVYTAGKKGKDYSKIRSTMVEWNIDVMFIKKVYVKVATTTWTGLGEKVVYFTEKYFDQFDVFTMNGGEQNFIVLAAPQRMAVDRWAYTIKLVSNDTTEVVGTAFAKGNYAVYSHNTQPELTDEGYMKYQANSETHRNHMTFSRNSTSWSTIYANLEDSYMEHATKEGLQYFAYKKKEKDVVDQFMQSRESAGLFAVSNFDSNGKCLTQEPGGQDLPQGDGIIKQIERYADIMSFNVLTPEFLKQAIISMRQRSGKMKGNRWVVVCNTQLYDEFQDLASSDLTIKTQNGEYFYSRAANGEVSLGADFVSYEWAGNFITFMPSKALTDKYDTAYGIILDSGIDETTKKANIAAYSLAGLEFITGLENGMGAQSGSASGVVSSGRTGSAYHVYGSAMYVCHMPYKAVVMKGN